jgi:protein MAK11
MSTKTKSAKTTERQAKRAKHAERSRVKPEKQPALSAPGRTRHVSFQNAKRADTIGDVPTEAGDTSQTSGREHESSLPSSFKIIAGSYDRLLYGLQVTISTSPPGSSELEWTIKPIFIFPAHVSCIKTVAASPQGGKWLATGSGDEIIKVWDLRRRKEIGGLMQHEGFASHVTLPLLVNR